MSNSYKVMPAALIAGFTFKLFVIVVKISLQFHRYEIDNLNFKKKKQPQLKVCVGYNVAKYPLLVQYPHPSFFALQQADGSWWNRNRESSTDE